MNDTMITVVGNVVDEPRVRQTQNGHTVANFRVASTSRRFDREQERFVDNSTLYVNVTAWRGMAENVEVSLRKGQPVVVTGRYYTRDYTVNEQPRTSYELEATALGHDLSRGTTKFQKVFRGATPITVSTDETGMPEDASDHYLPVLGTDSTADAAGHIVDPVTGEVLTPVGSSNGSGSGPREAELVAG